MGAPYIMPDGKPLAYYLKQDRDDDKSAKRSKRKKTRGKDEVWAHMLSLSKAAGASASEYDVAEYRILSQVGHRRRVRWFNEKMLRDMAGPLTAADMEGQFKPPPFGVATPTVFSEVLEEHAGTWDHFRHIDHDKQDKVLQRWQDHLVAQQAGAKGDAGGTPAEVEALQRWAAVGRSSRAALRRANVHLVLELETALLEFLHQKDDVELSLPGLDPYARLLLHGLCQYHSLHSSSHPEPASPSASQPTKTVTISRTPTSSLPAATTTSSSTGSSTGRESPPAAAEPEGGPITCTDVLLALQQYGGEGLTHNLLAQFVRLHIHGSHTPREPT